MNVSRENSQRRPIPVRGERAAERFAKVRRGLPFHMASYFVIGGGFWVIAKGWRILLDAARSDTLATSGPYAWVRHPQYSGFLAIMVGFLLQWPTLPTLVMFPVLVVI